MYVLLLCLPPPRHHDHRLRTFRNIRIDCLSKRLGTIIAAPFGQITLQIGLVCGGVDALKCNGGGANLAGNGTEELRSYPDADVAEK